MKEEEIKIFYQKVLGSPFSEEVTLNLNFQIIQSY